MRQEPNLLSTLQEGRCRQPYKARFRLRGRVFAGREWTALDRNKRIQLMSFCSPDFVWRNHRAEL